jgi:RNA polymerase sigma-70 factor (ECF subfamily)
VIPGAFALKSSTEKADAFLELLQPLQGCLAGYCRRLLRKNGQVEDALQTIVALAFSQFDRYTEGTNFKAWIFRIATLEISNRNRKRHPLLFDEPLDDILSSQVEELPDDALDLLVENAGLLEEHFDQQILDALWLLAPSERTVLLLRAIGEFSYHEMHEILSIPLGSVMGYLSRARRKMRTSLSEYAAQNRLFRRQESRP